MAENSPPSKRTSLKSQTHFNSSHSWKNKLKENCCKRVREDRSRLLWRVRLPTAQSLNNKDLIKSAFQDIVSDELKKIKDSSLNIQSKVSKSAPEADDTLWEYDGLHDAYQVECEEILIEMQRIFYEDLSVEPKTEGPENYTKTWEDEEDEYLAHAVFEHMQLNDGQVHKKIWCPNCKHGELHENHQLIRCTLCELKLSKGNEVNLEMLQAQLAEAHLEHLDRGCRLKPNFCIETRFGLTALYIICRDCNMFEVVI